MNQISVNYPETLAFSLKMRSSEFEREIKTASLVKLFEMEKVSSGFAAKILGISRIEFLDRLASYGVSAYANADELETDLINA